MSIRVKRSDSGDTSVDVVNFFFFRTVNIRKFCKKKKRLQKHHAEEVTANLFQSIWVFFVFFFFFIAFFQLSGDKSEAQIVPDFSHGSTVSQPERFKDKTIK